MNKDNNYKIENIYYNLLTEEWYKNNDARGYESEKGILDALKSDKILAFEGDQTIHFNSLGLEKIDN